MATSISFILKLYMMASQKIAATPWGGFFATPSDSFLRVFYIEVS